MHIIFNLMGNCETVDENNVQIPRQGVVTEIHLTHLEWSRKYQGLFDYETQELSRKKIKVQGGALLLKETQRLIVVDEKMEKSAKRSQFILKDAVFRLNRSDNFYELLPIVYEDKGELVQKPLWLVVKSLPSKVYSIREKDVIKLGKQKLKVRQVVPADSNSSVVIANKDNISLTRAVYDQLAFKETNSVEQQAKATIQRPERAVSKQAQVHQALEKEPQIESTKTIGIESQALPLEGQRICRFCLQPGLQTNPLITPCKCIGSVRYVHLLCLKQWLSKQIKAVINDFSVTINWRPLICEVCKNHYKYRIYLDNQKFYTVDIPKPQKPYIVLQILKKKGKDEGKIFKFITFSNKQSINIGRKKDVDVRISEDISVSRIHAILRYRHATRQFTLQDNHSKFGTLILAKNGLLLRPHHPLISIQVGSELYEFQALRQPSPQRCESYQLGDDFLRQERDEQSQEQQDGSEDQDEVMQLPVDDGDRSPMMNSGIQSQRSPSMRRSRSMQASNI